MSNNSTDQQRRVLGLLLSLLEDNRTKAVRDWKALIPTDGEDAKALLNTALEVLLSVTADPRLGGQREYVAEMLQRYVRMEGAGR
ncbi:hypothetical protein [Pseudarthrobacter oxydans]|uniref:hypothetical protein n=1 Tax=Pseudarthrobacter oxydans TaxID=1671 RepID=UPI00344318ED